MTYFDKKAVRRTIFGRPFQFLLPVCAVERTFVEHCAVVAAEFLCGKKGVYTMDDLLK